MFPCVQMDQGCNEYRTDQFRHRRKYWWAMFDRLFNIILNNAYMIYVGTIVKHNRHLRVIRVLQAQRAAASEAARFVPAASSPVIAVDHGSNFDAQMRYELRLAQQEHNKEATDYAAHLAKGLALKEAAVRAKFAAASAAAEGGECAATAQQGRRRERAAVASLSCSLCNDDTDVPDQPGSVLRAYRCAERREDNGEFLAGKWDCPSRLCVDCWREYNQLPADDNPDQTRRSDCPDCMQRLATTGSRIPAVPLPPAPGPAQSAPIPARCTAALTIQRAWRARHKVHGPCAFRALCELGGASEADRDNFCVHGVWDVHTLDQEVEGARKAAAREREAVVAAAAAAAVVADIVAGIVEAAVAHAATTAAPTAPALGSASAAAELRAAPPLPPPPPPSPADIEFIMRVSCMRASSVDAHVPDAWRIRSQKVAVKKAHVLCAKYTKDLVMRVHALTSLGAHAQYNHCSARARQEIVFHMGVVATAATAKKAKVAAAKIKGANAAARKAATAAAKKAETAAVKKGGKKAARAANVRPIKRAATGDAPKPKRRTHVPTVLKACPHEHCNSPIRPLSRYLFYTSIGMDLLNGTSRTAAARRGARSPPRQRAGSPKSRATPMDGQSPPPPRKPRNETPDGIPTERTRRNRANDLKKKARDVVDKSSHDQLAKNMRTFAENAVDASDNAELHAARRSARARDESYYCDENFKINVPGPRFALSSEALKVRYPNRGFGQHFPVEVHNPPRSPRAAKLKRKRVGFQPPACTYCIYLLAGPLQESRKKLKAVHNASPSRATREAKPAEKKAHATALQDAHADLLAVKQSSELNLAAVRVLVMLLCFSVPVSVPVSVSRGNNVRGYWRVSRCYTQIEVVSDNRLVPQVGVRVRKPSQMYCADCRVFLCIRCWGPFHRTLHQTSWFTTRVFLAGTTMNRGISRQ